MNLLLVSLAMGNWGNTPSPPLDPDAPDPVGNDGELTLDIDGDRVTYLVQTARLSEGALTIEGEKVAGVAQFVLSLYLSAVYADSALNTQALKNATLGVKPGSRLVDPAGDEQPISGGAVRVTRANGSGPWEVDGDVELATPNGTVSGTLEVRIRA